MEISRKAKHKGWMNMWPSRPILRYTTGLCITLSLAIPFYYAIIDICGYNVLLYSYLICCYDDLMSFAHKIIIRSLLAMQYTYLCNSYKHILLAAYNNHFKVITI